MAGESKLDSREFDRALRAYIPTTQKSLSQIINERSLNVSVRALQETIKTERIDIEKLGVSGYRVFAKGNKAKGTAGNRLKTPKPIYSENLAMRNIYVARMIKNGENPKDAAKGEIGERVKKAIGARLRSIAFLKSGWLPAIKRLAIAAGKPMKIIDAKKVGKDKGSAIAAKPKDPTATIINTAGSTTEDGGVALVKYGLPAMQRAISAEAAELIRHVHAKLQKDADKINAK